MRPPPGLRSRVPWRLESLPPPAAKRGRRSSAQPSCWRQNPRVNTGLKVAQSERPSAFFRGDKGGAPSLISKEVHLFCFPLSEKGKSMGLLDRSVQVCPGEQLAQRTPGTMYASALAGRAGPAGRPRLLAPARLEVILSPAGLISNLSGLCPPGQLPKRPPGRSRLLRKRPLARRSRRALGG